MARTLTLENMDYVSLQRTFDYSALGSDPWEAFQIQQDRLRRGVKEKITLGDVYRLFNEGLQFHEVKNALHVGDNALDRQIDNKTVLIGEAFYHAVNPGIKGFNKANIVRVLCDENIDEYMATHGALKTFGHASHTTFESLTGEPDSMVWRHAQKFDVIISKDTAQKSNNISDETRDLTNCAEDAWSDVLSRNGGVIDDEIRTLPIIIHIKDSQASGREIRNLLRKYKKEIKILLNERKSPVIELKKGRRPQICKHYMELIDGDREEKRQKLIDKRVEKFIQLDHLNLGKDILIEYTPTIRGLIENDVDRIMSEHKRNAEVLMLTLNDCMDRIDKVGTMTLYSQRNLIKQINNEKPQKELQEKQRVRREEFYSRKPHLRPRIAA